MALIPCPHCSASISDTAKACPKCGNSLIKKETIKCFECNTEVEKEKTTCPNCGVDFSEAPKPETNQIPPTQQQQTNSQQIPPQPSQPIIMQTLPKKKKSGLKIFLFVLLILAAAFIILQNRGYTGRSLLNTPSTINISATCTPPTNLLLKSETNLTVSNSSSISYNAVTVRIISYDANGNNIEEKTTVFDRILNGNSYLTKPIFIPSTAVRCDAIVMDATPNN